MSVQLIDANSYYRRRLESARAGASVPRILFHETFLPGTTKVYIWDGPGGNERRRALYPAYKSKRPPVAEPIRRGLEFFRELMSHSMATQLRVLGYEADDVIVTLAHHYRKRGLEPTIVSNDSDMLATGFPLLEAPDSHGVASHQRRLFKTLVGKPSDQNTGIPGFGRGGWDALTDESRTKLTAALEQDQVLTGEIWPTQRGVRKWVEAHPKELQDLWTISGFFDVPLDELEAGIINGSGSRESGEALLKEFML